MSPRVQRSLATLAIAAATLQLVSACSDDLQSCADAHTCQAAAGADDAGGSSGNGTDSLGGKQDSPSESTPAGTTGTGGNETLPSAPGPGGDGGTPATAGGAGGAGGGVSLPCDGACRLPTPLCDQLHDSCVECIAPADCPNAVAARCNAGECAKCTSNADCAHISGKNVCDTVAGECVQCTGTDYAACGSDAGTPLVCDSKARTCTTKKKASAGLCLPCVSDAQCSAGKLCVEEKYGSPAQSVGFFCFFKKGDTANGAPALCSAARPYVKTLAAQMSVDGIGADVCGLAISTCVARNQFRSRDCSTPNAADDAKCGVDPAKDSKCGLFDVDTYRCTMTCLGNDDCVLGSSCQTGEDPPVCSL